MLPIQSNEKCSSRAYSKMVLRLLLLLPVVVMTSAWGPKKYSLSSAIYQFNLALVLNKLQQERVLNHGSEFAFLRLLPPVFFVFFLFFFVRGFWLEDCYMVFVSSSLTYFHVLFYILKYTSYYHTMLCVFK